MQIIKYFTGFIYGFFLRFNNVKIHPLARITVKSKFEGNNVVNRNVSFIDSHLGFGTYISNASFFVKTKIGRYCSIGSDVKLLIGNHPIGKNVSTHPAFFSLKKQAGFTFTEKQLFVEESYADENSQYNIVIENDVWIGSNVQILCGVKIHNGAVIAAGSVVTKDVEPYAVVGGVPAKTIKYRFSQEDIEFLQKFKWWNKTFSFLEMNHLKFQNIDILKKEYVY